MKKFFAAIIAIFAFVAVANATNYSVDEASIDALFTEAVLDASTTAAASATAVGSDSTVTNAVALVVDVFFGGLGIHRLILGTRPINCLWYLLTLGGIFGIIPFVDGVLLIVDLIQGTATYLDNPAFIMWL